MDIQEGVLLLQHDTGLGAASGTVTVENGAALELGNSLTDQTGGQSFGRGVWGKTLVLKGAGNALFNDTALTVLSNNTLATGPTNNPIVATDNTWRGPISLGTDAVITVQPNSRLILAGPINDANNPSASGSSITSPEAAWSNSPGPTPIAAQPCEPGRAGRRQRPGPGRHRQRGNPDRDPHRGHRRHHQVHADLQRSDDDADHLHRRRRDRRGRDSGRASTPLSTIGGTSSVGGVATVTPSATAGVFAVAFGGTLKGFNQAP